MAVKEKEAVKQEARQPRKPASVTFAWNKPIAHRTIVLRPARTVHTESGPVIDDKHPAQRIVVKGGLFVTTDQEIIDQLKALPDFETKGVNGFRIMTRPDPKAQVKAIMEEAGLKPEDVLEYAGKE